MKHARPMFSARLIALILALVACPDSSAADLAVERTESKLLISLGGKTIAEYVYSDPVITRPYFANLCATSGVRLTRNHPPVPGEDRMDHPEYHPGVWLAFGDLSGADNWRLKAPVTHEGFVQEPRVTDGVASFAVKNRYQDNQRESTLCYDDSSYTLRETEWGVLLTWDTRFSSDRSFWFGDQEEMGLGLRLATPLRVEQSSPDPAPAGTGEIIDSQGRRNAEQIWGKAPRWIDYRGELSGSPAGVALFVCRDNFRASRMHARDYGFVAANPFALKAFGAGEASRVEVAPGESLRLRYGLLLHGGERLSPIELSAAYDAYCRLAED